MKPQLKAILFLSLICLISCQQIEGSSFESDLRRLDEALLRAQEYVSVKEQQISTIENMLNSRGVELVQQYYIYGRLFDEYEAFQFDKAKDALDAQIRIAEQLGDKVLKNNAQLNRVRLLTMAGYYHEADHAFDQIDTTTLNSVQMTLWYSARQKYLTDYNEYVSSAGFVVPDLDKVTYYQDKIKSTLPEQSYYRRHIGILSLRSEDKLGEAYEANKSLIATLDRSSRNYAVQAYWQGQICDQRGNVEEAIHWFVESALCDVQEAIKDNASLSTLAAILLDISETDRAFRYIRFSLEDASFYNAKLRKVQIATTFPMIEKAYNDSRLVQERQKRLYMNAIIFIACILAFLCVLVIRFYQKDRKTSRELRKKNNQLVQYTQSIEAAEESLRKTNLKLIEANAAKEEYIGLFLSMCSGYLDKLKKTITRDQYESELKSFYKTFDTSFLSLYPNFVEDFNALLQEEHQVVLKDGEMLNTELRIFALIKLGITQSSHIASLLRYSVNTIYNYRAQIKNAVKEDRENFEDRVKKIGFRR